MTDLSMLWLPIILSTVVVFIISSIIHMFMPWHKNDYPKIPNQDKVMDALRPFNIPPGDYMIPRASGSTEMKSAEFKEKIAKGPIWIVTVRPNGQWQIYLLREESVIMELVIYVAILILIIVIILKK
jgi:hypothetical protein